MDKFEELMGDIALSRKSEKESSYIENLLIEIIENGGYSCKTIADKFHCDISFSNEKHNALQYTQYYTITSKLIKGELNLEIENGISNGTQLISYSFEYDLIPSSRTVEVLKDIVLDEEKYKGSKFSFKKAELIFPRYKSEILELYRKQDYDNYVTGGGTNVTNRHYKTELDSIRELGLYWTCIYEEIEVDVNFVN